jgi:uncharacterized protein YndB with AHSA1/START domain
MEVQMPYTYTLTSVIPATPQEVYDAWLDSVSHSEMTGGDAVMSAEVGADVSAWDGYITGRNLELVPGERIVQSWRTTKFGDEQADSVVTITLEDAEEGTLLTLVHSNVPDEQRNYEEGGWESNYFEPMRAYFARFDEEDEEEGAEEAGDGPEPQPPAPMPAPRPARNVKSKVKRAATPKAKKAAPRAKAKSAKKAKQKTKRAAPRKAKAKHAKPAKRAASKPAKRVKAKKKAKRR